MKAYLDGENQLIASMETFVNPAIRYSHQLPTHILAIMLIIRLILTELKKNAPPTE